MGHKNADKKKKKIGARIFLAELYREKSDFDTCIKILDKITGGTKNEKFVKEKKENIFSFLGF